MLMKINQIMGATRSGYALAEPVVYSSDSIKWCFKAASLVRSPVVIGVRETEISLEEAADLAGFFSGQYRQVPAALSLENCSSFETAVKGFQAGFTNVVADYIEDERQLKYTVHMAHSAGCSAEAKLDIDSAILNQAGELKKIVENTGIDGIFLTGEAPKNNSAEKQMAWINQIKEIEEKLHIYVSMDGDLFSNMDILSFAARTWAARIRLEKTLSMAGAKKAEDLTIMPESDRRGLPRLQEAAQKGYEEMLKNYIRILNGHNRW